MLQQHHISQAWARAQEAVGSPDFHFHDLRHGGLTLVAITGASLREIMQHAGHSTVAAALTYQHVAEDRGSEIAAKVAALAQAYQRTS